MRILLTGSRGFVGSRVRDALDVVEAPSLRGLGEDQLKALLDRVQPDAVIHTAAMSDIGACAADPEGSRTANVTQPVALARCARGAKLVFFSSDQVYGSRPSEAPFLEADTAPENLYARQKLEMENRVLDICPEAVMLRATWMYDMPRYGVPNRMNLLTLLLRAAATGETLRFSAVQRRGVTYVREVAENLQKALSLPGGAYNFGSECAVSMFEAAEEMARDLGLRLRIVPEHDRAGDLWMDCGKLRRAGIAFSDTNAGMRRCARDYSLHLITGGNPDVHKEE